MTTRTITILLLCVAAAIITGIALALAVFAGQRSGIAAGSWLLPVIGFVSSVAVFYLARETVLPASLATPPLRALTVLGAWIGATMLVATLSNWVLRPVIDAVGFGAAGPVIWLVCILTSGALLERFTARRQRHAMR